MADTNETAPSGRRMREEFFERMRPVLGDAFDDFRRAIECGAPERALRENRVKSPCGTLEKFLSYRTEPLSYVAGGYRLTEDAPGIGNTPLHHAGAFYMQDPGAMATLAAVEIPEGIRAADLCAAPGGKASKIAEAIGKDGFLLANEYVPKRAKIVVQNFERLGITNAAVTSLDTAEIAKLYENYFDFVLVDAPCSGEGMFRKSEEANEDWSPETVALCAERQREILENAAKIVAPGGTLLYSTCTYSPEENEMTVDAFLSSHADFSLVPVRDEVAAVTEEGYLYPGTKREEVRLCRRFYPHRTPGEGQFIAVMRRERSDRKQTILYKDAAAAPAKDEGKIIEEFFGSALLCRPEGRIAKLGERLLLLPFSTPIPPHSVFSAGVLLGEIRGKNFFPSHAFFSAYGKLFRLTEELTDERAERYLRGEELDSEGEDGFVAVLFHGIPLGGGKRSGGRLKNHYPKGLRNPAK